MSIRLLSCHVFSLCASFGGAFSGLHPRRAFFTPRTIVPVEKPKLVLIGGCTGTGKSTFGMSVALDQGILKCISTDTLRSVMRSFVSKDISPALHRSSYESTTEDGSDDPIKSWKQTCTVLQHSIDELVEEMITKGGSVVIEGVHVIPDNRLIDRWEASGGVATGIVLTVPDAEAHKSLLIRRGAMTGKGERDKLEQFHRIRTIHDEMIRLANEKNWQLVEQNLQPDPLDLVANRLWNGSGSSKLRLDGLSETLPVEPTRSTDVQTEEGLNNNNNDNRLQMSPKT